MDQLNAAVWGPWMLLLLVGTGVFMTLRLGFLQFRRFGYVMKHTLGQALKRQKADSGEITPFQAVTTALAATVGTGNIAGVAGAITLGGPGAVFWMWVSAAFGMATKYSEVVLAVYYRRRDRNGEWVGGPMYSILGGLGPGWRWLAQSFAVLTILASFGIGNMTQSHTIAAAVNTACAALGIGVRDQGFFGEQKALISSLMVGFLVALIVAGVLFGGVKRIGAVTQRLVPWMAGVYLLGALTVILFHIQALPGVLALILRSAFRPGAVMGGTAAGLFMQTLKRGIGRGVFSNEAGMGSAPMAHASTSETDPVKQGLYGIFEVFMDTIVICTLTALAILTSMSGGLNVPWGAAAGTELVSAAFSTAFGSAFGALIIGGVLSLFALSTILSWALYGARACQFLFGEKSCKQFYCLFVIMILFGAVGELDLVWTVADTLNGFMAVPNLVALLSLSGVVVRLTKLHFHN